jgi:hypothetical protein
MASFRNLRVDSTRSSKTIVDHPNLAGNQTESAQRHPAIDELAGNWFAKSLMAESWPLTAISHKSDSTESTAWVPAEG